MIYLSFLNVELNSQRLCQNDPIKYLRSNTWCECLYFVKLIYLTLVECRIDNAGIV